MTSSKEVRSSPSGSREEEEEDQDSDDESSQEEEEKEEEEERPLDQRLIFERIAPVEDTPWSQFLSVTLNLGIWIVAFILVQLLWWVRLRSDVQLSFLPVSVLVVPVAFWWIRRSRYAGIALVDGLQFPLHWLLLDNWCAHELLLGEPPRRGGPARKPTLEKSSPAAATWNSMSSAMSSTSLSQPRRRAGMRYNFGLATCITFFWILAIGRSCWPCGYLYLVEYSLYRCQYACQELKSATSHVNDTSSRPPKQGVVLALDGNATQTRAELAARCREGFGGEEAGWHSPWSDPHWLVQPTGAWVIGQPFKGRFEYNASRITNDAFAVDCHRFDVNFVTMATIGLLAVLVGGVATLKHRSLFLVAVVTATLSLLCITGILGVWMGWVRCRQSSSLNSRDLVFQHLVDSCLLVASYNGSSYFKVMQKMGRKTLAYESNFRHLHQISRSEVWFGSIAEAFLLLLVIAAHSTFKHKRMQTSEARYEFVRRRPKFIRCILERVDVVLDRMPVRDRNVLIWTLQRVHASEQEFFAGLEAEFDRLVAKKLGHEDLSGVSGSFWPAAVYALLRALIPSTYRQLDLFETAAPAVPEENTLWMLSAMVRMVTTFVVYLFVLFQIREASRHYTRTMQAWLVFDSLWHFPCSHSMTGHAATEIVQVSVDEEGERLEMLDRRQPFIKDFGVCSDRCAADERVVNVDVVREWLPTWWAWREYLIIDYADNRVRLELHLVVGIAVLLNSALIIFLDYVKDGCQLPKLNDPNSTMNWFSGHVNALSFLMTLDLLFLTLPVLHALSCAATMNRLIETQLQRVVHMADLLDVPQSNGDASPVESGLLQGQQAAVDDGLGPRARWIFRVAREQLASGGSSATRLLSIIKIDRHTFAIAGTTLSLFTGSQFVEIISKFFNIANDL